PRGSGGKQYEAAFDLGRLRTQPHDLVTVTGRRGLRQAEVIRSKLLNQLGTGGLVLDQNYRRLPQASDLAHSALQLGELHFAPEHIKQIKALPLQAPGCADAVIGQLGRLVRRIPTLHDLFKVLSTFVRFIEPEPIATYDQTGRRLRVLLVLSRKVILSHRAPQTFHGRGRKQGRMKNLIGASVNAPPTIWRGQFVMLLSFRNERKQYQVPALRFLQVRRQD